MHNILANSSVPVPIFGRLGVTSQVAKSVGVLHSCNRPLTGHSTQAPDHSPQKYVLRYSRYTVLSFVLKYVAFGSETSLTSTGLI